MANIPCLKREREIKAVKYNVVTIILLYLNNKLHVHTYSPSKGFPFSKGKTEVHTVDKFLRRLQQNIVLNKFQQISLNAMHLIYRE